MNGQCYFHRPLRQRNVGWTRVRARLETGRPVGRLLEQEVWVTFTEGTVEDVKEGVSLEGDLRGKTERSWWLPVCGVRENREEQNDF